MWIWAKTKLAEGAWRRGEKLRENGQLQEARAQYEKAIRRTADAKARNVAAREVAARSRLGLGRVELALKRPGQAVRQFQMASATQPDSWQALYWEGCARGWLKDYKGAEVALTQALNLNPAEPRICIQRGYARFKNGQLDEAVSDLSAAASQRALGIREQLVLAVIHMRRARWKEAERVLQAILEENSSPGRATLLLGECLEKQEKWGPAETVYRLATRSPETTAFASARIGVIRAKLNDITQAHQWLDRAIRSGETTDATLFYHGLLCYKLHRFEECIRSWAKLHERHPERARLGLALSRTRYAWGCELLRQNNFDAVIPLWESYAANRQLDTAMASALAEVHFRVAAQQLRETGLPKRDEARRHLMRGSELAPEDSRFPFYLGLLEGALGRAERATPLLQETLDLNPDDPRGHAYLALCAARTGDVERVQEERAVLRRQDGRGPWIDRVEGALAALHVRAGRWSEAADVLGALKSGAPWRADLLGECLFRADRVAELLALNPSSPQLAFWQAGGCARQGRLDEAMAGLREIGKKAPKFEPARKALASLLRYVAFDQAEQEAWAGAVTALAESRAADDQQGTSVAEALIFLLAGRREEGITLLQEVQRRDPTNDSITHTLALACYHTARAAETRGGKRAAADSTTMWERAVASCVTLLNRDAFWQSWHSTSESRYRTDGSSLPVDWFRKHVAERLQGLLENCFDQTADPPRLKLLLQREVKAAQLLGELGGFPLPARNDSRLVCGPLMIRALDLDGSFGSFASSLSTQEAGSVDLIASLLKLLSDPDAPLPTDEGVASTQKRRLMAYFSSLGLARALLDVERPQFALNALMNLSCPNCHPSNRRRRQTGAEWIPVVCSATCPNFDSLNPGYAALEDKHQALSRDALELAVEANLAAGQTSIAAAEMDLQGAIASWREAIRLAKTVRKQELTQKRIVETALGRVRTLEQKKRLDEAVALLEAAEAICDDRLDRELVGRLSEILTNRGILAGNEKPPRYGAAVVDLRRAVQHNPHAARPLVNLSIALQNWAMERYEEGQKGDAADLLEEGMQHLEDGITRFSGHAEVAREYGKVHSALSSLFNAWGVELANADDFERSLQVFTQGLHQCPDDALMRDNWQKVFVAYITRLLNQGDFRQATRVLEQTAEEFQGDSQITGQIAQGRRLLSLTGGRQR